MLRNQVMRVWDDVEPFNAAEAEELDRAGRQPAPPRTRDSGREGVLAVVVGGIGIAIMFFLVGEPVVGLVVGGAAALLWLLWRYRVLPGVRSRHPPQNHRLLHVMLSSLPSGQEVPADICMPERSDQYLHHRYLHGGYDPAPYLLL